jgi:hypothetical protein
MLGLTGIWPGGIGGVLLSAVIGGALVALGVVNSSPLALVAGAFVLLRGGTALLKLASRGGRRNSAG